ncbi:RING finger domain-containing protein [Endozoicomonas sp. ALB091]|uniref:RING finger domain-containing protein n=1 Tax=Endozoicomonas sp. ALB091 TaxID=3403073 RepID=UPI003BB80735
MNSVPFSTAVVVPTEPPTCPICHDDLYSPKNRKFVGRHVAIARPCGHKFHFKCLSRWTKDYVTCPYGQEVIKNMVVKNLPLPRGWKNQMVNAAEEGDIKIIQALLQRGAKVDAGQTAGETPLALAVANKHLDAALLLAGRGGSDPIGLRNLGNLFKDGGEGIVVDLSKSEHWYLKAAGLGDACAMNNLALLYLDGGEGLPADHQDQGKFLLFKAAGLGDSGAMSNLGWHCFKGDKGFEQDLHQAKSWWLKAVELRYVLAMHHLGSLYLHGGENFPADLHQAKTLLLKVIELGKDPAIIASAMYMLGRLYQYGGEGFKIDLLEAERWYLKAIELGSHLAMSSLGHLYLRGGEKFPEHRYKGKRLLLKAAQLRRDLDIKKLKKVSKPQPAKKRGLDEAFPDETGRAHTEGESTAADSNGYKTMIEQASR